MVSFWGNYLKALAVTTFAMIVYSLTIVPWIEPTEQKSYAIPDAPATEMADRWWQGMFAAGDWQLQQPTVVHNSRGVLLAKEWEQISPESWKLRPLTIIVCEKTQEEMNESEDPNRTAWVVSAEEAIIHFEQPFDLRSGMMPSVQKGQLAGEISITQINTANPNLRPWQLRTRDISIDRRRIWTPQEVQIEFENSRIRGHDLRINLLSDILSNQNNLADDGYRKYGPLEEIELLHLTELQIALKPGGIWSNVSSDMLQLTQPVTHLPARLEANCGGRFSFNFSKETAALTGGVHLRHYLGGLPPDEFLCHRLSLRLQSSVEDSASGNSQPNLSGMVVRNIDAYGVDSLEEFVGEKWVELKSPLAGATARAKRLHYDLNKQRIELAGKLDQPGATVSIAELNYRGFQFQAPVLEYQSAPRGPDGRAIHAGWLAATGQGELSSPSDSQVGSAHVRWQDSFTWSPTDKPGQQVIVLAGKTLVEQEQQGFMTADRLSLWLNQVATQQRYSKLPYEPTRILAEGNSVIATDTAHVTVQSIDVSFVSIPTDSTTPTSPDGQQPGQFVKQPLAHKPAKSTGQTVTIDGQTLTASVANRGGQMWIDAMSIHGPLHLRSESSRSSVPWRVEGEVLNLGSTPEGDIDIEIAGQPASVHIADGSIMGPKIGFNQKQNRIWMDHPGEFTLPVEMGEASSQQLRWAKPLRCTWQRRMMFDGDQVRFEGDIELLGTLQSQDSLWFLKGTCQELALAMNQTISLAQLSSLKTRPSVSQLEQIVLRGDVDLLASRKDEQGNRLSRARLRVPSALSINVPEQKVVAAGPGSAFTNYVNSPSGTSPASTSTAPLNTLSLTFRDSLVAFLDRKEVVVDGNVKILSSPIASWDEELTPDGIGRLLLDQFTCVSDQVKLYDTNSLNSTQAMLASRGESATSGAWEVQVTGNVRFEGATSNGDYSGNAYQAVYVQARDQLYLSGDGRSKAEAVVKKRDGGSSQLDALTTLRLSRGRFNVKTLGMEDPQGLEVHVESPNAAGDPALNKSIGGGSTTAPTNNSTLDPRDRSINRLLQGFGPQQP